jgi:hypothetical protein
VKHVPDLVLERLRLGELPEADARALRARLESDPELRARLEALERSDAELGRKLAAAGLAERARELAAQRRRAPRAQPSGRHAWPVPAGLAAAATLALAFSLRGLVLAPSVDTAPTSPAPGDRAAAQAPAAPAGPPAAAVHSSAPAVAARPSPGSAPATAKRPGDTSGDRIKGLRPSLTLFRKTPSGSEVLADGDGARPGDVVRVGYNASGRRYGVIVSLDGRGSVTRHLPAQGRSSAALEPGDVVLLAQAYELDDAPAWERFFFVTADEPFDVAAVEDAARRAAASRAESASAPLSLGLPKPLEEWSFLLTKERRP